MQSHANVISNIIPETDHPVDGYSDLAAAIIIRAVNDYRDLFFRRINEEKNLNSSETERFFKSSWFKCLTRLDGTELFDRVKHDCKKYEDLVIKNVPKNHNEMFIFTCPICGGTAATYLVKGAQKQKNPIWTAKCFGTVDKKELIKALKRGKAYYGKIGCGTTYRFMNGGYYYEQL